MARISDRQLKLDTKYIKDNSLSYEKSMIYQALLDLQDCRSLLNDFLARMVDVYDGGEGADNRMPFTGSDIEDIRRVVG